MEFRIQDAMDKLSKLTKDIKKPYFVTIIMVSVLTFCFTVTSLSGGWVVYEAPIQDKLSILKVGLFNSAAGNDWRFFSYGACIDQASKQKFNQGEHYAVCNGRLSLGILLSFSIATNFFATVVLTLMLVKKDWVESILKKPKYWVMGSFLFSALVNFVSLGVGAGVLYATISKDEKIHDPSYGHGFYFTLMNALIYVLLIPAVYVMVSGDGYIQTLPRPKSRQKSFIGVSGGAPTLSLGISDRDTLRGKLGMDDLPISPKQTRDKPTSSRTRNTERPSKARNDQMEPNYQSRSRNDNADSRRRNPEVQAPSISRSRVNDTGSRRNPPKFDSSTRQASRPAYSPSNYSPNLEDDDFGYYFGSNNDSDSRIYNSRDRKTTSDQNRSNSRAKKGRDESQVQYF
jgi:hypothetical protein